MVRELSREPAMFQIGLQGEVLMINCGPRGGTGGAKPGSTGPEVLGPLRGLGIRPLVSVIRGLGETPSQRPPLRAPERLSGPRGRLFRGLGEGCPFSKERGRKVGHSEALRGPVFPDAP